MEINTKEDGELVFSKVYAPIRIIADPNQPHLRIAVRNGGFEVIYGEYVLSLKKGQLHYLTGNPDD